MTEVIGNYIKGTQITTTQGDYQDVFNPATGSVSAQVCMSTTEEVDQAVNVATEAAKDWGRTPSPKRAQVMFRFKRLLEENSDKLARIISSEHGKTHDDALGEVVRGLEVVEFACGIPQLIKGTFSEQVADGIDVYFENVGGKVFQAVQAVQAEEWLHHHNHRNKESHECQVEALVEVKVCPHQGSLLQHHQFNK